MKNTRKEILFCEEQIRLADASSESDTAYILDQYLADDVIMIGPKGEIFNKEFVLDAHRAPKKQAFSRVEIQDLQMKEMGNVVFVECKCSYERNGTSFILRFTRLWSRAGDSWKVVGGSVTNIV